MNCTKCQKTNKPDSKFCRFCGVQTTLQSPENSEKTITISMSDVVSRLKNFFNKKMLFIVAIVALGGSLTAFAAPKINDYLDVNDLIKEAKKLELGGDYQKALATLGLTSDKWMLGSTKQEIESAKLFNSALEKEKEGALAEAREILQGINSDFSRYEEVKNKLSKIQTAIESNLEEKAKLSEEEAKKSAVAAADARRRARTEASARAKAEANEAASAAQARTEANSRARAEQTARVEADARARAEQAARNAEYQRQQEEQARVNAVRLSFRNQLNTIYDNFNNSGTDYYNDAVAYYNNGYPITAVAKFGQADALFKSARSDALNMQSTFSNMPEAYNIALNHMISAATQCSYAVASAMEDVVSDAPSVFTSNYTSQCFNHGSAVANFLNSN